MQNRVELYSYTGALKGGKLFKLPKIEKMIAKGHAMWITVGVSAQLLYMSDVELEIEVARECAAKRQRVTADASDDIPHMGKWQVMHPSSQRPAPSIWNLKHPRRQFTVAEVVAQCP